MCTLSRTHDITLGSECTTSETRKKLRKINANREWSVKRMANDSATKGSEEDDNSYLIETLEICKFRPLG